jgi:hypothetical protein
VIRQYIESLVFYGRIILKSDLIAIDANQKIAESFLKLLATVTREAGLYIHGF